MKMVMISYNEAIENEVMELMVKCSLKNYTKIMGAFGSGETSGIHLGTDIWPGRNNILYVACAPDASIRLLSCVRELRAILGKEGVKAFAWNIEEST
ncbi:MAG: PG0541 family transporter-associated protein [Candidatus Omnitrophota bacterium]